LDSSRSSYSHEEEWAHRLTHLVGIVACLVAIPWLALTALRHGDAWQLVGGVVFGMSALLLFTTSVLYHSSTTVDRRLLLRKLDHCAIYVLIAGTYTPVTLGVLRGSWGWALFGAIWTLALLGIVLKLTPVGLRFHRASVVLYLVMGWLIIVAVQPLAQALTDPELAWIIAGGLFYTAGVPFYLWKSRRYTHAAWHVFVLAGVGCHFVAVLSLMESR
jgi:hemolysin III